MPRSKGAEGKSCCTRLGCIILLLLGEVAQGQLSKPVANDSHWHKQDNKFLSRKAENDKEGEEQQFDDIVGDNICPLDVELKWMTEVSSSVYATPLITDLYADGRKDIIVPGFVHYTEVLEGPDGAKALGWPGFHKSTVHASPLLYDIDSDGIRDILVATYDGEVLFFKDNGEMLSHRLVVPRLRVRKHWYVGLNPDPVDHSHPDVGANQGASNPYEKAVHGGKQGVATAPQKSQPTSPPAAAAAAKPAQPAQPAQQQLQQQPRSTASGPMPVPAVAHPAHEAGPVQGGAVQQPARAGAQHPNTMVFAGHPTQQQQQHQPSQQLPQQPAQHQQLAQPAQHPQQQQHQPSQQLPQQPAQQQQLAQPAQHQQQPAQAAAAPAVQLSQQLQEAVLKYRNHLKEYATSFGQAAADVQLEQLKSSNRQLYDAIQAAAAKEREMQQLLGSLGGQQQQQPGGTMHARRRLMSIDGNEDNADGQQQQQRSALSSSSSSSSNRREEPGAAKRRLLQGGAATAAEHAAASGKVPAAAGVESDPNHKPLTQEALDSFKIFDDGTPAAVAAGSGPGGAGSSEAAQQQQPEQQYGAVQEPEDLQEGLAARDAAAAAGQGAGQAAAAGEAAAGGAEGAAAAAGEGGDQGGQYPYTYPTEYDELGDKLDQRAAAGGQEGGAAAAGGSADGAGGAAAGQQQQLHGLHRLDHYYDDGGWEDEMFQQAKHQADQEYVFVDAHILCTPAIADIDGDQHEELVLAVSYFYDKEYYNDPSHAQELQGVDKDKYVAGGIVVFDLRTRTLKWQQHLDLTTAHTKFTAHMFSSPTLADIDADGAMEVVVGTSVGFVYVLDSKGSSRTGWPIQMGEVQGQVLVADLNADGAVEIFAGDALGNIALLDVHGKELWERHVKSMITQGGVAGDIDGDGLLEIVFGTADGRVHAVRGTDGRPVPGFPFQTGGRIQAPATITNLARNSQHQHILIMSFDGFLYLIDGKSACAHTVDIGEASYAAVLVDDLAGDGMLELLVATMNGNVYMLQSQQRYHPAKTWSSQVQGINGLVSRWGYFGFVATAEGRQLRDVAGQQLQVQVELWDERTILQDGLPLEDPPRGPYNITVMLKGVGVAEMNAGLQPVIGMSDVLEKPGKTVIEIPCPRTRTTAAVHLDVITKHGLHFEDEFVLSFHMHFHKLLKWLIALPLLAMASVAVLVAQSYGFDSGRSHDRIV